MTHFIKQLYPAVVQRRQAIARHGAKAVKLPLENGPQWRDSVKKIGPERICLR